METEPLHEGGIEMEAVTRTYRDLQQHLDRQVVGYPATKSGAELRILKKLFTPEEAQLAMQLTYRPTSVATVHERAQGSGVPLAAMEQMLNTMAINGVIGRTEKEGTRHFYNLPLVVGMYEGQMKRLDREFLDDFESYATSRAFGLAMLGPGVPQMRTIPVEKSLSFEHQVTSHDHLEHVITGSQGPFAVLECICRKAAGIHGNTCKKTARVETCMAIGDMAMMVIESDSGRAIEKTEALEIARMNQADGLVLQPSNTRKIDFVCACCGCCCGMLATQKKLPKPVEFWATNFNASVDADLCTACGTCVERCAVDAVAIDETQGLAVLNLDRCIGCGNCVVTCPAGAMALAKKDRETVPPADTEDLYQTLMANKKGPLGKARLVAKLMLKQ
jgi:Na+-translocating ferredoxin:NAD+ oxidoreductase subunit B